MTLSESGFDQWGKYWGIDLTPFLHGGPSSLFELLADDPIFDPTGSACAGKSRVMLRATAAARKVCARCPIFLDCLNHVVSSRVDWESKMMWAGLAPRERLHVGPERIRSGDLRPVFDSEEGWGWDRNELMKPSR